MRSLIDSGQGWFTMNNDQVNISYNTNLFIVDPSEWSKSYLTSTPENWDY